MKFRYCKAIAESIQGTDFLNLYPSSLANVLWLPCKGLQSKLVSSF